MPTDYRDAAERHWEDADYLSAGNRHANADHLFGFSAECALKAVMQGLGMSLRLDGTPMDRRHRVHINQLWNEFIGFAQGRTGARYTADIDATFNPFDDWDVGQRYCHRADITEAMVEKHRSGTEKTKSALHAAVLDGMIS